MVEPIESITAVKRKKNLWALYTLPEPLVVCKERILSLVSESAQRVIKATSENMQRNMEEKRQWVKQDIQIEQKKFLERLVDKIRSN
ncbi:MAG: hypothetical protein K1000chlam2_00176 [Chlamydiae bacterium]|nr:hypothetical protein [Chlamydiota bacterium]